MNIKIKLIVLLIMIISASACSPHFETVTKLKKSKDPKYDVANNNILIPHNMYRIGDTLCIRCFIKCN